MPCHRCWQVQKDCILIIIDIVILTTMITVAPVHFARSTLDPLLQIFAMKTFTCQVAGRLDEVKATSVNDTGDTKAFAVYTSTHILS